MSKHNRNELTEKHKKTQQKRYAEQCRAEHRAKKHPELYGDN